MRIKVHFFCILIIVILVSVCTSVYSQTFDWARKAGTNIIATGASIATDDHSNSYVTGSFFGKAEFGEDIELNAAVRDIYLVKYDSHGKALWARKAGGNADDFGNAVALDKEGNCYLAGSFASNAQFGKDTLFSKGQHDMFIAKYSSKGELLWSRSGGGYYDDHAMAVTIDRAGNAYVAGYYKDTMWFSNGPLILGRRISLFNMFLAKYDSKGNLIWAKPIAGSNYQTQNEGLAIVADAKGMVYLTGYFQGEAMFDKINLTNHGTSALFIAKYDGMGKNIWVKSAGADGSTVAGKGIAVNDAGDLYVTGSYTNTCLFDTIRLVSKSLGYPELFLAKYNTAGDITWLRSTSSFGAKTTYATSLDAEENPYVVGSFRDTATFGDETLSGMGTENMFVAKYDPNGSIQWAKQVGRHGMVIGRSVSIDKAGNLYIVGNFSDTADFGKSRIIANESTQDMFFTKIIPYAASKEHKLKDSPSTEFQFLSCYYDRRSSAATIRFSIPRSMFVTLGVYGIMGVLAESFIEGQRQSGVYEVKIDLKNFLSDEYYCRLQAGDDKITKKIVIQK